MKVNYVVILVVAVLVGLVIIGRMLVIGARPVHDDAFYIRDPVALTMRRLEIVQMVVDRHSEIHGEHLRSLDQLSLEPHFRMDGWGRRLHLKVEDSVARVVSAGPDGVLGTEDDLQAVRTPEQ
jgi:hypothetical protein